MKWYIGIQSQIVTLLMGGVLLYYFDENNMDLPARDEVIALSFVFLIAFIGGFMAPYNVTRTAKYGSATFTLVAGIPLLIILYAAGEINNDTNSDLGAVIVFILLIAIAIALGVSIVIVAVILFVGGFVGTIFGKMVFRSNQYEDISPKRR